MTESFPVTAVYLEGKLAPRDSLTNETWDISILHGWHIIFSFPSSLSPTKVPLSLLSTAYPLQLDSGTVNCESFCPCDFSVLLIVLLSVKPSEVTAWRNDFAKGFGFYKELSSVCNCPFRRMLLA